MDSVWTAQREGLLRELIADRVSSAQAGKVLGCSRNACLGKAHRMGLRFDTVWRKDPPAARPEPRVRQRKPPPPPVVPIPIFDGLAYDAAIPKDQLKTILELEDTDCHWPIGSGPPFLFCAAPVVTDCSWCLHHRNRAFTRMGDSYGSNRTGISASVPSGGSQATKPTSS